MDNKRPIFDEEFAEEPSPDLTEERTVAHKPRYRGKFVPKEIRIPRNNDQRDDNENNSQRR